jgi:chromosome segregation ATPase
MAISDLEKQKKELVDNLTDLSKEVRERENGLLSEIERLTQEIMDKNEILQRGEKAIKEARERAEAEIREGKTIDSKAIVDLKVAKQRIDELETEIIQLRKNRNDLLFVIDGQDIKILDKEKEVERKQKERDNAIENLEIRNKELKTETQAKRDLEKEKIDWETERKNKKEKIANLKKKVNDLEKELKKHEPSMLYQIAEKLGIPQLKNSISNVLIIAGAVVVLYGISWM